MTRVNPCEQSGEQSVVLYAVRMFQIRGGRLFILVYLLKITTLYGLGEWLYMCVVYFYIAVPLAIASAYNKQCSLSIDIAVPQDDIYPVAHACVFDVPIRD